MNNTILVDLLLGKSQIIRSPLINLASEFDHMITCDNRIIIDQEAGSCLNGMLTSFSVSQTNHDLQDTGRVILYSSVRPRRKHSGRQHTDNKAYCCKYNKHAF